jgi:hypothetical protein
MILTDANYYLANNPGWAMYNADWAIITPSNEVLFNFAITYKKGAGVLHMLRYALGDSVFFNAIKSYATDTSGFKNKNVVTDDFTAKVSQSAGQDISWFINEWVKQPNHPVYGNVFNINKAGSGIWNVSFEAKQVQVNSIFHKMPLVLKVSFTSGADTNISVINDQNNQQWSWTFDRHPIDLVFDPNNDIVLKEATTLPGPNSETRYPGVFLLYQNHPNPFNPFTSINYDVPLKSFITLKIYDITGKLVATPVNEQKIPGRYSAAFDGNNFPSGIYFYKITARGVGTSFSASKKMVLVK